MKDIPLSPRIIEIKRKRRIKRLRGAVLGFILLIVVIIGLSYFSNNEKMTISSVETTGNHIVSKESIEEKVFADISGKYLYLFSKANSFIYPRQKIYDDLIFSFPRIEKLSIYTDNLKTLHVDLSERVGSYLYCGATVPVDKDDIGENCYFINDDGFVFDEAPYFSGDIYFKYYVNINSNDPLSKQILPKENFHKIIKFIEGIRGLGFKPIYLVVDSNDVCHLYLDYNLGDTKPEIVFIDRNDLDVLFDNLSLAMKKKEFSGEINSKYNSLLYIDLRFKNKVLYKFQ